jgi:hypothetical protein
MYSWFFVFVKTHADTALRVHVTRLGAMIASAVSGLFRAGYLDDPEMGSTTRWQLVEGFRRRNSFVKQHASNYHERLRGQA